MTGSTGSGWFAGQAGPSAGHDGAPFTTGYAGPDPDAAGYAAGQGYGPPGRTPEQLAYERGRQDGLQRPGGRGSMVCARCGNAEDAGAAFCSDCGSPLASSGASADDAAGPAPAAQDASAGPMPAAAHANRETRRDPGPEDYGRAKAAGIRLPQGPAQRVPASAGGTGTAPAPSPAAAGGVLLLLLGAASLFATIALQSVKVSSGGVSLSASQVNGICQSALGQLGQAFSGGFGDSAPQAACARAATVEDWKGVTFWLGLAVLCGGLSLLGRRQGRASSRSRVMTGGSAASPASLISRIAAAERAEADAARLRAQAAQMQAGPPQPPGTPATAAEMPRVWAPPPPF